jgi:hypothetical protein
MVGPECDENIPDENELDVAPGIIRLGVVADLGWTVGKLIEKPDEFPLLGLGQPYEKCGGFGREDRFVCVTLRHVLDRWQVWINRFFCPRPFPS